MLHCFLFYRVLLITKDMNIYAKRGEHIPLIMGYNQEILKWEILRKSSRKIRKDIGEEINEIFLICCYRLFIL
jgi:hypothetical protein